MFTVETRLQRLERQNRILRIVLAVGVALFAIRAMVPLQGQQTVADVIRTKSIIVEDAQGRPRVVLGGLDTQSPTRRIGVRINDEGGLERFGAALMDDGRMVVGLDAPPGTGDERNRERITLVAERDGGSYIRFLDRRTSVPARIYMDSENQVWLEFADSNQNPRVLRRLGVAGDQTTRLPTQ